MRPPIFSPVRRRSNAALLLLCCALLQPSSASCEALPWNLPSALDTSNTTVGFEVDSTWHTVRGQVRMLSGKAWLADRSDEQSVAAEIAFPVDSFATGNSSRDRTLREVMAEEKYPAVRLTLGRLAPGCTQAIVQQEGECRTTAAGKLTVRGVAKNIELPVIISRRPEQGYNVSGEYTLRWDEFGVDDPSMLVARLDKAVKVNYSINLFHGP